MESIYIETYRNVEIRGNRSQPNPQVDDAESLSPSTMTGVSVRTGSAYDEKNAKYVDISSHTKVGLGLGFTRCESFLMIVPQ
jgi:hypothetical protein